MGKYVSQFFLLILLGRVKTHNSYKGVSHLGENRVDQHSSFQQLVTYKSNTRNMKADDS